MAGSADRRRFQAVEDAHAVASFLHVDLRKASEQSACSLSACKTEIAENDTGIVSSRRLARRDKRKTPITQEAQFKPIAELRREGRLTRIAKALASGATITDIAEAEGIGRMLASREANSPECKQLIAEFVGDEWEEMRAVFYRSMCAIEHALSARREYLTKDGRIMQGGPVHYARHFRDFLMPDLRAVASPRRPVVSHPLGHNLTFRGRHALAATSGEGRRLLPLPQKFEILYDFAELLTRLI